MVTQQPAILVLTPHSRSMGNTTIVYMPAQVAVMFPKRAVNTRGVATQGAGHTTPHRKPSLGPNGVPLGTSNQLNMQLRGSLCFCPLLSAAELRERVSLYNTMSKSKEPFRTRPGREDSVSMYVCGVTVYDYSHIGEYGSKAVQHVRVPRQACGRGQFCLALGMVLGVAASMVAGA